MRTRYGHAAWIDGFPDSRRPSFEPYRGDKTADVAIIGGGLTGLAIAHALSAAKRRVVLLEAGRIAQGAAGRGSGLLLGEPGPSFRDLVQAHGLRSTRVILEAWRKAAAVEVPGLLRRAGIKCDLTPVEYVSAVLQGERDLRRDAEARESAGVPSQWLDPRRLAQLARLDAAGAARLAGGATLDPYKLCVGLARAAVRNRARLFERSVVQKVTFGVKDAEVTLDQGTLRVATVIVATGAPAKAFKPLQRHFTMRERYVVVTEPVPAPIRRQLFPDGMALRVLRTPPHHLRWAPDHRLVISGADQERTPEGKRDAVLIQRTGQLMYELLTEYPAISGLRPEAGWDMGYADTADGLPYIGPHRNYPRHLFALGGAGESIAGAFVAAKVLSRAVLGTTEKTDQVFGWTR